MPDGTLIAIGFEKLRANRLARKVAAPAVASGDPVDETTPATA